MCTTLASGELLHTGQMVGGSTKGRVLRSSLEARLIMTTCTAAITTGARTRWLSFRCSLLHRLASRWPSAASSRF